MDFILYCLDKPGRAEVRRKTRALHLEFVAKRQERFRYGGPLLDEQGSVKGSLMIVSAASRAELAQHIEGDAFFSADLFESVTIWASRQVIPETAVGALDVEVAQAWKAAA